MSDPITVVARSMHTRLVLFDAKSDFTLVTFSAMRPIRQKNRFWGDTLARKAGIRTLAFVAESAHWYSENAMHDLIEPARALIADHRAVTYGFSMGAYGALKYSAALGVDTALAFSPQISINPNDTDDPRFTARFSAADHGNMRIAGDDLTGKCIVVADKLVKWDDQSAREIAALAPDRVRYLPVVHAGHASVSLMLDSTLAPAVLSATNQSLDDIIAHITPLLMPRKKQVSTYYSSLSLLAGRRGRAGLARRICQLGLERAPTLALHALMGQHIGKDDPEGAIDYLNQKDALRSPKSLMVISRAHRMLGNPDLAQDFRRQAFEITGRVDPA